MQQLIQLNQFLTQNAWLVALIGIWVTFWKGCALWIASKNDSKKWFILILILNTIGILEIIYIFFVAKKSWNDFKGMLTGKAY